MVSVGSILFLTGDSCKDGCQRVEEVFLRLAVVAVGVFLPGHGLVALAASDVCQIVAFADDTHSVTATPSITRHPLLCWYPQ